MPKRELRVVLPRAPIDRATLEAAHAAVARIGPQPGIRADTLLPPLPFTPDALAGQAALCNPPAGDWVDMPILQVDPRAPWRQGQMGGIGAVQRVICGFVLLQGAGGAGAGWKVTLLHTAPGKTASAYELVAFKSGRLIRFDSRSDAERELTPVVDADGVPPSKKWAWAGLPYGVISSGWVPRPYDQISIVEWRGRTALWAIWHSTHRLHVRRDGVPVGDPVTGGLRMFKNARDARQYCESEDQR